MNKLKAVNGYARLTFDKFPGIGADLVNMDDNWQKGTFSQLVDALRRIETPC